MPYGMPNLSRTEYRTLVQWLAAGARPARTAFRRSRSADPGVGGVSQRRILRERLMSRYLCRASLPRPPAPGRNAGTGVLPPGALPHASGRARRRAGDGATHGRPDPRRSVPADAGAPDGGGQDHVVYGWSPGRMARYRQLFLEPDYTVTALPSYDPATGANPLKAFVDIPVESRYRFMLDDARFFIELHQGARVPRPGGAQRDRGPVLVFFDPERAILTNRDEALAELRELPAFAGRAGQQPQRVQAVDPLIEEPENLHRRQAGVVPARSTPSV